MRASHAVILLVMFAALAYVMNREVHAGRVARLRVQHASESNSSSEARRVDWKLLRTLDIRTNTPAPELRSLESRPVAIPGFIVPLEDNADHISEFLLVPYFGACVHTPPPPPNQMVYVRMKDSRRIQPGWGDPVWVHGELKIALQNSPFGKTGYQLSGVHVEAYRE